MTGINFGVDEHDGRQHRHHVPVVSAATNMIYCATKVDGDYAYVGLDWTTGETKQTWLFPDDGRKWNALGRNFDRP